MPNRTPEKKRKFVSAVGGKPGTAKQVREAVAQAVRHPSPLGIHSTSNFRTRPVLQITPLDYEDFIRKNRIALESDSLVDIDLFPKNDIIISDQPMHRHWPNIGFLPIGRQFTKEGRWIEKCKKFSIPRRQLSFVQNVHWEAATSLLSRQCLKTYVSKNIIIEFKFADYGKSYADLIKRRRICCDLPNLDYEENLETDARLPINPNPSKEGYLFIYNMSTENNNSIILKNSKKRYCCLCRDVDNSYKLDFYKDNPRVATSSLIGRRKSTVHNQPKLTLYLDLFLSVSGVQIRNRQYIQIALLNDGAQKIVIHLSFETDRILDEWLSCLKTLCSKDSSSIGSGEVGMTTDAGNPTINTPKAPDYVQFLTASVKTTIMKGQSLITDNTFLLYPLSKVSHTLPCERSVFYSDKAGVCKERNSIQCLVEITSLNIRLPTAEASNIEVQIEPFFVSMFLFDVNFGSRISETVYLDANSTDFKEQIRAMCSRNDSQSSSGRSSLSSIATANSMSCFWGSSSKV
uniref:PH domain-containing protein n=1 Tax=Romanomermis culicivorax TaxID=13658 RepID=A0A915HJN0_ROMCU